LAGNRLTETIADSTTTSTYNTLNQLSTTDDPAAIARTNQWDAQNRLVSVTVGSQTTQFGYDGASHLAYIRQLQNGSQVSLRYFVWCNNRMCEERDASGTNITKRFYAQGVVLQTGTNAGAYFYTRDHLGSIRELTDAAGNVRARYSYDPFGRQTKVSGDLDADFGFAGMFWCPETSLAITHFRDYDPNLGRWLSRDPLENAEIQQGPNLYAYVRNSPPNLVDPSGKAEVILPGGVRIWVPDPVPYKPPPPVNPNYVTPPTGPESAAPLELVELPPEPPPPTPPPGSESWFGVTEGLTQAGAEPLTSLGGGGEISLNLGTAAGPGTGTIAELAPTGCGLLRTFALPLDVAFRTGWAFGRGIDDIADISGWAANNGEEAYEETDSGVFGGFVTIEESINPFAWLRHGFGWH
jgi:RHS repeat-associated protein